MNCKIPLKYFPGLAGIILLAACTSNTTEKTISPAYFSLKTYFEQEALRLNQQHLQVLKTVSINGIMETKKINDIDFKKELASFADADINKSSWKGAFRVEKKDNLTLYYTNNKKIPVKRLEIYSSGKRVKSIRIIRSDTNILYRSADTLVYKADSLYEIRKVEKVKLLSPATYGIKGKFLHP